MQKAGSLMRRKDPSGGRILRKSTVDDEDHDDIINQPSKIGTAKREA